MIEIIVKKDGDKWGAYVGEKRIATSSCRPCVVHAVLAVTKRSGKYDKVLVHNEDGSLYQTLPTGDGHGRHP